MANETTNLLCPIGTLPYSIKNGDTISALAKEFKVTVRSILIANPGIEPSNLKIGETICIPRELSVGGNCGTTNYYVVETGDSFYKIAMYFEVPLMDLINLNPNINPNNLFPNMVLCIPLAPSPMSIGISIEHKRLDLYRRGNFVKSYPVATGKPSTPSPIGTFAIFNKQVNPGGPFGTRWMGLTNPGYGIHGTNSPSSIGNSVSNGCIRMQNEDANKLFNEVPVGTQVRIFL
jgi:lipoprotein-anchoring transpeptidase ErfK/SrfK